MNDHIDRSSTFDQGKTGRPPVQRRAMITREGILESCATLFSRTGFAGTSINDILAISKSTKGAMYSTSQRRNPSPMKCSFAGPKLYRRPWGKPRPQDNRQTGRS